jgi:hypothetical protein
VRKPGTRCGIGKSEAAEDILLLGLVINCEKKRIFARATSLEAEKMGHLKIEALEERHSKF